jgi:hypothetical protein
LKSTPVTQTQNLKLSRDREGAVNISATAGSPR